MKKKHIVIAVIAVIVIAFLLMRNCGGSSSSQVEYTAPADKHKVVELTPHETSIKGYLASNLAVVDGTYKLDYTRTHVGKVIIQVKIKSLKRGNINDYGLSDGNNGPLYLSVCDKDGMPISDFTDIHSSFEGDGLLKDMLSKVGEENWIEFNGLIPGAKVLPDEAATFIITSKKIEKDEEDSSDNNESMSSSDSQEWDKVLDDYEAYVDKNLKIIKKMKNDDLTAIAEYPALMEKAKDLEESLQNAQKSKSLSSKQINRMMKIQTKMLQATQDME